MTQQIPMRFGTAAGRIIRPTAPDTSRAAGLTVDTTAGEALAYHHVRQAGLSGLTAKEYARIVGKPLNAVSGRFTGLQEKSFIVDSGRRRERSRVMVSSKLLAG